MAAVLQTLLRPRTYLAALFIASRLPLGLLSFLVIVVGLSLGIGTVPILVGIGVIALTFAALWYLAAFERLLVRRWLGVEVAPMSVPRPPGRPLLTRLRDHLANPVTWKSLLYLLLQFPAGLVGFTLELAGLTLAAGLGLAPLRFLLGWATGHPAGVQLNGAAITLTTGAAGAGAGGLLLSLLLGVLGAVLLVWMLWLLDKLATGWGLVASRLLGTSDASLRLAEAHLVASAASERAEHAERGRRELIVNVSHELRTPIASIRAHLESLSMRDGTAAPDADTARYLAVIGREVERLNALVDDLLTASRADAGELRLTLAPVSVVQVVRHVREALGPMARRQRGVTLVERLPGGRLPAVLADPDRLTQVMMNLVRNAIAYTPEGGLVSIEAAADAADHVALTVADTGIGIAPDDLERVFDRLYRTDASRARSTGGSGLGLSIARELVEAMGGTISAESVVDEGSRFTVRLRAALPAGPP